MKIKLDENIPATVAELLTSLGHDADTVPQEGLTGQDDQTVWRASQEAGRFLITQDLDFSDIRAFKPGTHCGLLVIRLTNPARSHLIKHIHDIFKTEAIEDWEGCFIVTTERKIRVQHSHN